MSILGRPVLMLAVAFLLQTAVGLRVSEVVAPARPPNAIGSGLVILEVGMGSGGKPIARVLLGEEPFIQPSMESLRAWQFNGGAGAESAVSTVTFLYRPATIQPVQFSAAGLQPWVTPTRPAVPRLISDPGYPPVCVGAGTVILEAKVDSVGDVSRVTVLSGPAAFTERAEQAVRSWKFQPAQSADQPVRATSFVVISFARPLS
jgi:TonB family protein